jgi:radical SAM-linked protein
MELTAIMAAELNPDLGDLFADPIIDARHDPTTLSSPDEEPEAAFVEAPTTTSAANDSAAPVDKLRFRFRKDGPLRWLSHHDLIRTFERLLRRCELPFRRTRGFNPQPRLVFALSLPLGVIGCEEIVDIEFDAILPPEEVLSRMSQQSPPGLSLLRVQRVAVKNSARVTGFTYALSLPPQRCDEELHRLIAATLASRECLVDRKKPTPRRVDIRPFLRDLRLSNDHTLEIHLWLTDRGTARPDEVLRMLGLADIVGAGSVLERTRLDLANEPEQLPCTT